jgi:hypothetical protein
LNKLWKLAAVASAALVGPIYAAMPAGAVQTSKPPIGYGFDGTPHNIVAGGSDTTYHLIQNIADVYQLSAISGCGHATSINVGTDLNKCATSATQQTDSNLADWQGDTIGNANPTGSGAGVGSLNGHIGTGVNVAYQGASNPIENSATCMDPNTVAQNPTVKLSGTLSPSSAKAATYSEDPAPHNAAPIAGDVFLVNGVAITIQTVGAAAAGATSSTNTTFTLGTATDSTATFTTNQFAGQAITDGSNSAIVASNTGQTITLLSNWAPAIPADTSVFTIAPANAVTLDQDTTGGSAQQMTLPQVDFARSSGAAKTTGGNITGCGGNELNADTFWGYAEDAVAVAVFGTARANDLNAAIATHPGGTTPLSPADLYNIWECHYTMWSQVPSLQSIISPGGPEDGPIVPWAMNSSSGTYNTFNAFVTNNAGLGAFTVNDNAGLYDNSGNPISGKCDREIHTGTGFPLENDIKPLVNEVTNNGGLSASATSGNNPKNWIWFGSNGVFSAFPYTSSFNGVTEFPAPVDLVIPSTSTNLDVSGYAINRTLWHVTRKSDADCPVISGSCNFTIPAGTGKTGTLAGASGNTATYTVGTNGAPAVGDFFQVGGVAPNLQVTNVTGPGPYTVTFDQPPTNGAAVQKAGPAITASVADLNVKGAVGGTAGAVREFTRFICRPQSTSFYANDPYTGTNMGNELVTAISNAGFTVTPTLNNGLPANFRSPGSKCFVQNNGS